MDLYRTTSHVLWTVFVYFKNALVLQGKAHLNNSKNIQIPY